MKGHHKPSGNGTGCKKLKGRKIISNVKGPRNDQSKESREVKEDRDTCCCGCSSSLACWLPWSVAIVTAAVRISYVTSHDSYWILHPDEVYQSIEGTFVTPGIETAI